MIGAESAADVAAAVQRAADQGWQVSVQATGHGAVLPVTSGLMITTSRMNEVAIDPAAGVVTVGAGATWDAVIAAAAEHGLAPIAGASLTVGVVGLILGGGLGPLARSHGFAADYAEGFTVVTGTGEIVTADRVNRPDLFWALRGGRFGLGVVTEVRLRLVELASLYGGTLLYEEPHIETALRAWIDYTTTADDRVSTSAAITRFPNLPAVPEAIRGRTLLSLRFAFPGDGSEGERLAAPLRSAAPVYLDRLGVMKAADIAQIHNDPTQPGPVQVYGNLLSGVDQDFASAFLTSFGPAAETPFVMAELRHLGAATRYDLNGESAVAGRSAGFTCGLIGVRQDLFDEAMPAAAADWTKVAERWFAAESNPNIMGLPVTRERLAAVWPREIGERLETVRRRYDPLGVLAGIV
ncbi:FAD-binding oxidoreductase [Dactylosporangium fulvum]|uniref:FAD-binding protein n=1 Tax=Dactylosporangium fulvum TaxID=53359 RepID=A0ABY5VQD4_9ACTN|nr:FAD-binding protein [Dactylosporangium fulvum]UWP79735.1 FAD-binding protein [Dactylosporangium fulvum]